jgi:hypothetical protein
MGKKIENNFCEICNKITNNPGRYNNKIYCQKHILQMKRHGQILNRTRFDPNEIVLYDDYAEIILYDKIGIERDRTIIDLDDVEKCKLHKWHKKESIRGKEYIFTRINRKIIRLHRYILNFWDLNLEIDHIDGNGLNNRKNNLDTCTHQQNMQNQRKLPSNNTSGYIGVIWNKKNKCWNSQIKINKKHIYLGSFYNIENAISSRKEAEIKYFGKNKRINFE